MKLDVHLKHGRYDIYIQDNLLKQAGKKIKDIYSNKKIYIVTDHGVPKQYLDYLLQSLRDFEPFVISIEPGEAAKSLATYEQVTNKLIALGIRRDHLLIALGGGVIGDLTGFIAATLFRGIDFVQIPTTLLAQVDSSIGGKVGINLPAGKNLLGAFYQPKLVLIDPLTLHTLPKRELSNGVAELIKHGFIRDKSIIKDLESDPIIDGKLIYKSLRVKRDIVILDELDRGDRMLLNFGHTFGHAIEKYGNFHTYLHGESVGLGMLLAIRIGEAMNITQAGTYERLKTILTHYNLPTDIPDISCLEPLIKTDKKHLYGKLHFILLKEVGHAVIHPFKDGELKAIIRGEIQ